MQRAFLTISYLAAHLAAAATCFGLVFAVPLVSMIVVALWSGDLGGPLFWPLFVLFLVVAGVASGLVLSTLTALADFARQRWRAPLWVVPLVVFLFAGFPFARAGHFGAGVAVAGAAACVFALYWFARLLRMVFASFAGPLLPDPCIVHLYHPCGLTTRSSEQRLAFESFLYSTSFFASLCR